MARYRLDLEYDGSDFWGWQHQPERRTVQGVLEAALARVLGEPVRVIGAGRTDRGVHATGQVAHCDARRTLAPRDLGRALAGRLPGDVRLRRIRRTAPGFHARFDASRRHYVYLISRRRSAFARRFTGWVDGSLDLAAMRLAARDITGERDFRPFAVRAADEPHGRCEVWRACWSTWDGGLRFSISADRFLMRMVRMLVGTMVEIGRGRLPPTALAAQLAGEPARRRPAAIAASGLYLAGVGYAGSDRGEAGGLDIGDTRNRGDSGDDGDDGHHGSEGGPDGSPGTT